MKYRKNEPGPFSLGLFGTETTPTEIVGTLREELNGNKYRYARAGATALAQSKHTTAVPFNADWVNETPAAAAIGAKEVVIAHVAVGVDVLPADYFRGGQLHVNDATGEGYRYPIAHSSIVTATSTSLTITMDVGLKVALTSSSEVTPVPSPYMATVISATATDRPVGVPLVAVAADAYYWSQTKGEGMYLGGDTTAVGLTLILGTTDGSLLAQTAATIIKVAYVSGTAAVSGEYKPCCYCLD